MNIGSIPQKWARQTPHQTAIIDATTQREVSFADLDRHVRQVANSLLALGLQKGDRVAVLSQNSIEYVALYFACARVGFVVQPMNWRLAAREMVKIVENGEPRVFVTQGQFSGVADELKGLVSGVQHWVQYGN
ncbi:MAG: AMP-binding protein, partial [Planctomycetes bacterium]|nr:AMP-binding protein [Planctomycetota bacterium]